MKKSFFILAVLTLLAISVNAQTKADGTPDMRYKANKQAYGNTYSTPAPKPVPAQRNYSNGGQYKVQDGYQKKNGQYVAPHIKTTPDNNKNNNYKPRK